MSKSLVLVTRRFWPLVGGAESQMARLAAEFQRRGWPTTILTARWDSSWPEEIEHHGVRVVRLSNPAIRFVGTWRYMGAIGTWLAEHRGMYHLAYVSQLKHDAYATLEACGDDVPVVLRAAGTGATGDCHWQREANFGARIARRCQEAAAVVAPSPAIAEELKVHGYSAERVHYLPNGVAVPATLADDAARDEARAALAAADPRLQLPAEASLAVFTGRLHEVKNLPLLLQAWRGVLKRVPEARLWLVGEGPQQEALARQIARLRLGERVFTCGPFDDTDDILAAANLFLLPSREEGMSGALLEAMAAGVPVLAGDIAGNRIPIEHGRHGLLLPVEDVEAWAGAIAEAFDPRNRNEVEQRARAARRRVQQQFSLARAVERHLALFESLLGSR